MRTHLDLLKNEYSRRVGSNPHYSLRSFARDLEVPPSWLSDFLNSKKGMSLPTAKKICMKLGLSPSETRIFLLNVRAHHSRRKEDRQTAKTELKAYQVTETFKMRPADFFEIGSWYHQAILELTELEDFDHTESGAARRLGLPLTAAKKAIESLKEAGLLKTENGRMKASFTETESPLDTPSLGMRIYQEQILKKAILSLNEQSLDEREIMSVTFAFDAKRIAQAKKVLRRFQKQFTDEFYSVSDEKNSVYQFSFQLFRLDKPEGEVL